MEKKIIKYVAFYTDEKEKKQNRHAVPAAIHKVNYICSALNKNGYQVRIISPGWTNHSNGFYPGSMRKITRNISLKTFSTFGSNVKIFRMFKYAVSLIQLFLYLIKNTKKEEPVLVYHSMVLCLPVLAAKLIKRFELILEVEEIYQKVKPHSLLMRRLEFLSFEKADKFLTSTEELDKTINPDKKPSVSVYGSYQVEEDREVHFTDKKIHVVYSGTFDPRKGASAAVLAAPYLPPEYHIHILGFGSKEEKTAVLQKISDINKISSALVTYDGLLTGEDYIGFLQKCDIGLCTQTPDASFNSTSFPSKILTYLANGLSVVSVRLGVIEQSPVGNLINYYTKQTPESIAEAILTVNKTVGTDGRIQVKELDKQFVRDLKRLLDR